MYLPLNLNNTNYCKFMVIISYYYTDCVDDADDDDDCEMRVISLTLRSQ